MGHIVKWEVIYEVKKPLTLGQVTSCSGPLVASHKKLGCYTYREWESNFLF